MRKILISKIALKKMEYLTLKYPLLENGGFIFGRMNPKWLQILDVSDAGEYARRSYSGIEFENTYLTEYTESKVNREQFLVGTWHSHPIGASLIPSQIDCITMNVINDYYENTYNPVFFITKIVNERMIFSIYEVNEKRGINKIINYELLESGE